MVRSMLDNKKICLSAFMVISLTVLSMHVWQVYALTSDAALKQDVCIAVATVKPPSSFAINYECIGAADDPIQVSSDELKRADEELNNIYRQVLTKYSAYPEFISTLIDAQRAWIKYRDAHLRSLYPEDDKSFHYGSIYHLCFNIEMAELTWSRVKELNRWLQVPPEGELCTGSMGTYSSP